MSAKMIATNVLDIDAISKTVLPSTLVELRSDMFPYPETCVPFGVIIPTTIGTAILESKTELFLEKEELRDEG